MCAMATSIYRTVMRENCNVPSLYWQTGDIYAHNQIGSYFGRTLKGMERIHGRLLQPVLGRQRRYAANEGSLEDDPLFPQKQWYTYVVLLRDPVEALLSGYRYAARGGHTKHPTWKSWIEGDVLGGCITRGTDFRGDACHGIATERMVRYSKYKGRKKRAKYDPASPIGPQMWYNMVTKRLCGNACEPGNLEDPTLRSMYSSLHGADGQTAPSGRPDTNTTMPRTVQNLLVEKNSDVGKLHLEQAKQHLAKFDIVMFLDDFDTGLSKLAKLHPEWENATAAHSNRASAASATQKLKKPYLTLAEELAMPGVKALVDDVTGLDQTLYAWAKKHFGGT